MSKIGRKPIDITGLKIEISGNKLSYKKNDKDQTYTLPKELVAVINNSNKLVLQPAKGIKPSRDLNRIWGLHRALLSNEMLGSQKNFEKNIEIVGLGYKAAIAGNGLTFSLGYSHKIDFPLPKGVKVEIDKTGQKLSLKASDKVLLGQVCSDICVLRSPEPYKGTGIKLANQEIRRKVGKKAK